MLKAKESETTIACWQLCLKGIEELGDSGLPLTSAERLAFPASLKQLSRLCLRTAEAEPPQ